MCPMKMNSSSLPQGTPHNHLDPLEISLIRDYWKSLESHDDHTKVVVTELFVYVVNNYPHLRPLWPFGRKKYINLEDIKENPGFVNHINNVVTALNLCVTYLSNPKWLTHILQDVGCRHFFYDAMEPHFEVIGEALIAALKSKAIKSGRFTSQIETAFIKMFKMVQESMSKGLGAARIEYLKTAVTKQEMVTVAQLWEKVNISLFFQMTQLPIHKFVATSVICHMLVLETTVAFKDTQKQSNISHIKSNYRFSMYS